MGLIKMYAAPITYKVNGPGTTETAQGYVARPVRYSTVDVQDLADHIAADSRVERSKISVITDSLIKQIREMVLNGHSITVPHLGTFKPKIKSKMAPNLASINAASFVAKVNFRPSVELKRELQSTRIEKMTPATPLAPVSAEEEAASLVPYLNRMAIEKTKALYPDAKNISVVNTDLSETVSLILTDGSAVDVTGHILVVNFIDAGDNQKDATVGVVVYKARNSGNKYNPYVYVENRPRYLNDDRFVGAKCDDYPDLPVNYVRIENVLPPM